MADNPTVDNGALPDYIVSADEVVATGELLQRVKLAYSADGVATHVTADADGLLVNLGANNDVTVTGSVSVGAALPAGTNAIGKLAANSGVDIGDVDVTSVVPGTGATNLGKAEDAAHSTGDVGVMALTVRTNTAASRAGTDGDYQPLITDTNGRLHTIEPSQASILTAVQLIDNASVNHDAAVVAGVTQIGLDARSTDPTAVASGDATRALATLLGKQVVYPYALPGATWSYAAASGGITNTTAVTIKAAAGAGIRNYIAHLDVVNAHATVSTEVVIRDGAAGTVIWRGYCMAAGGGYSIDFVNPLRGTANTLLEVAAITTGAAVYVNATGFVAAE